jgi:hypothetical protein
VTDTRRRFRLIACSIAIALAAAHIVTAAPAGHLACVAAHHGCASTALIAPCCCGDDSQASRPIGPAPLRFSGGVSLQPSIVPAVSTHATAPPRAVTYAPPAIAIARDIPILLANLRL